MTISPIAPELPRDRYGRPLVKPVDGGKPVPYTRCTTYVDCLDDKFNLQKWQQRMVATGLAQRPDLLLAVSTAGDDKRKLDQICDGAREHAGASAAATTGTALHALTEAIDRGQDLPPVPEAYLADLEAYKRATAELEAVHIEQFSVVDDLKIGGTSDRVVTDRDGRLRIADVKTGSIQWGMGKIAMQLAVYAHSVGYDFQTGKRFDLGDIDTTTGIVIHLPAGKGTCELVEVDLTAGWEAVQLATQVRAWRSRKDLSHSRLTKVDQPNPLVDRLANEIATAMRVDDLSRLWTNNQQAWTPDLTALAAARKNVLEHKLAG